jgi:branched-chain amino acid transport system permease protein
VVNLLFGGLVIGSLYALAAVGLTLLFGAASMSNLAQGEFVMLGGYLAYWLFTSMNVSPLISLVLVAVAVGGLGVVLYAAVFSRVYARELSTADTESITLLLTFAVIMILSNLVALIFTPNYRSYAVLTNVLEFGGVTAMASRLACPLVAIPVIIAFWLIIKKTWFGRAIRCVIEDRDAARVVGVNVPRVYLACFIIGLAMAAVTGVLFSMIFPITPYIGIEYTMASFVAIILGTVGSIPGALIGGLIIGLAESTLVFYLAPALKIAIIYTILIVVLLVKPRGIFAR